MNFMGWVHTHRFSLLFLIAALIVGGLAATSKLPVALFPYVSFPRVVVNIDAGDRPAERMMIEVTFPIEQAVRAVPGVRNVRSTTSRGSAEISINFDWGEDMVAAMLQVESAINQVMPSLPQGTTFNARRMDPTVFPVLAYSLTSDIHSLVELRDWPCTNCGLYCRPSAASQKSKSWAALSGSTKSISTRRDWIPMVCQ